MLVHAMQTMSMLNCNEFIAVYSKHSHNVDLMTPGKIKNMIWDNFACTVSL